MVIHSWVGCQYCAVIAESVREAAPPPYGETVSAGSPAFAIPRVRYRPGVSVSTEIEASWLLTDGTINRALGAELRRRREAAGLTRPELVEQLAFKVTVATLLNWELGYRAISYARLVEIARTLHTSAPEMLRCAIEHIESIQSLMVQIDLAPVCRDENARFALLRTWAENKLVSLGETPSVIRVHHTVIRELAVLMNVPLADLVGYLTTNASLVQLPDLR
jgi:transcriptional regulator with XRE-family HTH domain